MKWIQEHPIICKLLFFIALFLIGWFWLFKCSGAMETTIIEPSKPLPLPKTFEKPKYKDPEIIPNVAVKKKASFKKKEKALRDSVEKKDIILDIKIVDNHIIETVIDTSGQVSEQTLDIPIKLEDGIKELAVVPEGVQAKEKTKVGKFLQKAGKKIKTGLIVIGGVTVIVVVAVLASGN